MSPKRVLVFTATYNERDNIETLLKEVWAASPSADVLVVDDHSPDGTGQLLDTIALHDSRLKVIHRKAKLGLGSAHKIAFKYAQKNHYDALITMDADFSHDPKEIPKICELLADSDFVIGSRFAPGGSLDYSGLRLLVSRSANVLARYLLGISLRETTTSYRGFRSKLLKTFDVDSIAAEGYSFFFESVYRICQHTTQVKEFPIHFEDRRAGVSKISKKEIFRGCLTLFRLFFNRVLGLATRRKEKPFSTEERFIPCPECKMSFYVELPSAGAVKCLGCGTIYSNPSAVLILKNS